MSLIKNLWKKFTEVADKNQGFQDRASKRTSCIAKEMKLQISDRIVIPDPDNDALTQAFNSITNKDEFVILEDATDASGLTYLQVAVFDGNFTNLQYQEGALDRHYNALEKNFTQKEIIETFLLYAKRDNQWKTRYNWEIDDSSGFEKVSLMGPEEARKYLENKYGNLKIEEVVFSKDIGDSMKKLILTKLHSYEEAEATELLEMAQTEAKKAKLREVKTKITQKAQELYPRDNMNEGRQPISDEVKIFVWQRDGGKCVKCGGRENLEYDHIIPVSKGGSNTERNIQLLCEKCNRSKKDNIR